METKVGAIVLATEQGLGYLAKEFFDNGIINNVYIHEHSSRKNHREWYPRQSVVSSPEELIEKCDTIIFFEEVFHWKIIPKAREKKVKTVLMVMYECTRNPLPYQPDVILCPSDLDMFYYPNGTKCTVPVDSNWKLREKAKVFVHNAGNGGLGGRNGTRELIEAMQYVKSPIKLIIRSQSHDIKDCHDDRVEIRIGSFPKETLYEEGDVFIFPEKFNGLSLPIQEAFASGMPVMCGNRFPFNQWLPTEIMIPVDSYKKERISVEFDSAQISPVKIAETIDRWYDCDITKLSLLGKKWGEENSWKSLKNHYLSILKN